MNMARAKILFAENGAVVVLVILFVTFSLLAPRFLQLGNLQNVVLSVAEVGLVAIPLAFLVMSGSIDLSVGSVASLAAVIGAQVSIQTGNVLLGIAASLACGLVTGAINGFLVEYMHLHPLAVTIGFLNVWAGLALYLSGGKAIVGFPPESRAIGQFQLFGVVPLPIVVLALATVFAWWYLNHRPFGRRLLAAGGNQRAAYLMGINVRTVRMRLFLLAGVGASMAGVLLSMRLQAASPVLGQGMEFSALTIVLLGGVAFAGGYGRISGVIAGLLFVGVLRNGLIMLGVSQFLQTVMIGLALVLAISLDETLQRIMRSAWTSFAKDVSRRKSDGAAVPETSIRA